MRRNQDFPSLGLRGRPLPERRLTHRLTFGNVLLKSLRCLSSFTLFAGKMVYFHRSGLICQNNKSYVSIRFAYGKANEAVIMTYGSLVYLTAGCINIGNIGSTRSSLSGEEQSRSLIALLIPVSTKQHAKMIIGSVKCLSEFGLELVRPAPRETEKMDTSLFPNCQPENTLVGCPDCLWEQPGSSLLVCRPSPIGDKNLARCIR
jgi:hypothetical protein